MPYGIIMLWLYPALLGHIDDWCCNRGDVGTMFLLHRNMPQLSFSVIVLVSGATGLFFLAVIFGTDTFFSLIGRDHTFSGRIYIWELAWPRS